MKTNLVALHRLLGLVVGLVGVVQGDLKLVDVSLQLLLDPEGLGLDALLALEGGLHAVHGTGVVLPATRIIIELLIPKLYRYPGALIYLETIAPRGDSPSVCHTYSSNICMYRSF